MLYLLHASSKICMWNFLEIAVGQIWVQEQFELLYNILLFTLSFTRCVYQFIRNGVSMLITHSLKGGCLTCIVQLILQRPAVTGLVLVLTIEIYRSQGRTVASREISTLRNCPAGLLMLAQPEQASKVPREIARLWKRAVRLWDFAIANVWVWSRDKQQCRQARGKTSPWNGSKWVLPSATKWRHLVWNFATRWRHHH